jgi:hypothetical protein
VLGLRLPLFSATKRKPLGISRSHSVSAPLVLVAMWLYQKLNAVQ